MASEHGSFSSRGGGSFTAPLSPWAHLPPNGGGGYVAPMGIQYGPPGSPHAQPMYLQGPPHSPYFPAPLPQILPQNSYLIDDRACPNTPNPTPPSMRSWVATALPTTSFLSAVALLVMSVLTFIRDHDHISVKAFWLFALGGLVSCFLSFCSTFWGSSAQNLARFGLFVATATGAVSSAYWFYISKEGMGVLLGGHSLLAIVGLCCGNAWVEGSRGLYGFGQDDFSFAQGLLSPHDLRIGQ